MNSVLLLTCNHPTSNPRVVKEANALAEAGFQVEVATSALPGGRSTVVPEPKTWRLTYLNQRLALVAIWRHRILKKTARFWPVSLRPPLASYGSLFWDLYQYAKENRDSQILSLHLEPALLAGQAAGLISDGVVDFEDWYSEDLLPESRSPALNEALRKAERAALHEAVCCWCPSQAMASALAKRYRSKEPLVIRNTFPRRTLKTDGLWKDRPEMVRWMPRNDPTAARPKEAPVSIHWFSQTIGPGRGLETLFQALEGLEGNWELHLRGNLKGYEQWLERVCPTGVKGRLKVHTLVENGELPSRIAEHDIGFAGEPKEPPNKNFTISNKFFQYLQAGLAVVASDTAGQCEAAASSDGAAILYPSGNEQNLRKAVQRLVKNRDELAKMQLVAWEAGERLCWENESPPLVEVVRKAMGKVKQTRQGAASA